MSFKRWFAVREYTIGADAALLLIRVVAGVAFAHHGWGKIQDPFGWMGPDPFAPGVLVALAAVAEFGGGIAWALGLLTPLASLGIASTMAVAVWFHAVKLGDPFTASGPGQGSYEPAAGYFCLALLLLAFGPGRFSLDRLLFGRR